MHAILERPAWRGSGFGFLLLWLILFTGSGWALYVALRSGQTALLSPLGYGLLGVLLSLIGLGGFKIVQPNQARVLLFFGRYAGTLREAGFWFVNPLVTSKTISLRMHNFTSERLKVNDALGNPIEIAAVVVWRVVDTARAAFEVEDYRHFVSLQSEAAIRSLASHYPYDPHDVEGNGLSLRGQPETVAELLRQEVQDRLQIAGLQVLEARISHLAYAPEIAQAMLRRQQAQAVIAARRLLVEGAVGMVQEALEMLSERGVVRLDEERKATMINNLLVALVSEEAVQPVVNTGTLYT